MKPSITPRRRPTDETSRHTRCCTVSQYLQYRTRFFVHIIAAGAARQSRFPSARIAFTSGPAPTTPDMRCGCWRGQWRQRTSPGRHHWLRWCRRCTCSSRHRRSGEGRRSWEGCHIHEGNRIRERLHSRVARCFQFCQNRPYCRCCGGDAPISVE